MFAGDSLNSYLVAVVCLDPDVLKEWTASENIKVIKALPRITVDKTSLFPMIF